MIGELEAGVADPGQDGWMLPPDFLARVQAEIRERQPALIVECGSGRSTWAWAEAATGYGGCVVSLEHDPVFHARTLAIAGQHEAAVVFAPLRDGWYARHAWSRLSEIGMLIVDGPPGWIAKQARHPALPLLQERLADGALIVLDDTHRADEAAILDSWLAEHPGLRLLERVAHSLGEAALLQHERPAEANR